MNYYNEYEPFAAEWLKELIKDGLIPDGEVDTRSIVDVEPGDLKDFTQCHFFAGIGGWAYAARLAGWGDDRPMWTGSPPCQPFSVAGKQKGTDDERHLWPVWFNLVRECKPSIIFGEQVAAAIRQGWLDSLQEDLEAENYACAAAVLPASGVGALHKRDRLWIVAHASGSGRQGWGGSERGEQREIGQDGALCSSDQGCIKLADSNDIGHQWNETIGREEKRRAKYAGNHSLDNSDTRRHNTKKEKIRAGRKRAFVPELASFWDGIQAVQCKDGKVRAIPTQPEIFPLANGLPNRVGILRGAGNAIVPQVAAEIIKVFT
jgi:DNA (cytosine-5)-methyltransferase 1